MADDADLNWASEITHFLAVGQRLARSTPWLEEVAILMANQIPVQAGGVIAESRRDAFDKIGSCWIPRQSRRAALANLESARTSPLWLGASAPLHDVAQVVVQLLAKRQNCVRRFRANSSIIHTPKTLAVLKLLGSE